MHELAASWEKALKKREEAYGFALEKQRDFFKRQKRSAGAFSLNWKKTPSRSAVVLLGRPYNAFAKRGEHRDPGKIRVARRCSVIPVGFPALRSRNPCDMDMCWAIGQNLMKVCEVHSEAPAAFRHLYHQFQLRPRFVPGRLFPRHHEDQTVADPRTRQPYRRRWCQYAYRGVS